MRKIINHPEAFVDEMLDGLLAAHPDLRAGGESHRVLVRADAPREGKVGIVTGGGSGHLPLFLGYVGEGLCTSVAIGNVFSSPSPQQCLDATRAADGGRGVLYLYGNYGGDVMNFDFAAELAEDEGIETATVLGLDDVISQPVPRAADRRGVAGIYFAYKCAGAAAEEGRDLAEVAQVARRTVARTGTVGIGLSPTILPTVGKPTFTLPDGEMEIGIGIHGEPGAYRGALESADEVAERLLLPILEDRKIGRGARVAVLVNGMGATPLEELYLLYRRSRQLLDDRGITVAYVRIGEFATSLEMAGASISVLHLDDELERLVLAPARSPFYLQLQEEAIA